MCKTFLNCNLQLWFAPQKNNTGIPLYSCKQAKPAPSVWQLSCNNTDINYLLTTIPFQHLMYRITAVYISCVIKFISKRKLSNYIYKTTPLFLSTNQKFLQKMTYEYLASALLVHDLLECCIASCLALLYIEITSYYYSG